MKHGERRTYAAGCHCTHCRRACARYEKRRRIDEELGRPRTVPIIGALRRRHALNRLGWSDQAMSIMVGKSRNWMRVTLDQNSSGVIYRHNHDTIVGLYDRLSMKLPPVTQYTIRTVANAEARGWLPPLAWDDELIDDPSYDPTKRRSPSPKGQRRPRAYNSVRADVDEAVVLRVLSGEQLPTTTAERAEIVRRWMASGRSEADLCDITGWRGGRYIGREDQVS